MPQHQVANGWLKSVSVLAVVASAVGSAVAAHVVATQAIEANREDIVELKAGSERLDMDIRLRLTRIEHTLIRMAAADGIDLKLD